MGRVMAGIMGSLALVVGFFGTATAGSISGAACPAHGTTFTVNDAVTAGQINDGFNCPNVHLVINFSLSAPVPAVPAQGPPAGPGPGMTLATVNFVAASIVVTSPGDPTDPAQRVLIINDVAASQMTFTATTGNIKLDGASIKAHKLLKFRCTQTAPPCEFESDNSDLIAATSFTTPVAGGGLFFDIFGPIDIRTTNVHGGDNVEMESVASSITMICTGGTDTGCKDPNLNPIPQVVLDHCTGGTGVPPIIFPCTLPPFQNAAELKAVCFPVGAGVECNGGHKEKRFTAGTFIDFTGSTITSDEHVTFTCKGINFPAVPNSGDLKASGATFIMDSLVINCKGKVDISKSTIVMAAHLTVNSGINCPAGTTCIDASGASPDPVNCPACGIEAKPMRMTTGGGGGRIIDVCASTLTVPGSGFPTLNGGVSPPYGALVKDTAADCAPRPATIFDN